LVKQEPILQVYLQVLKYKGKNIMATLLASSNSWESETVYKGTDVALVDLTASAGNAPDEIAEILRQAGSDVSGIFATEQKKIPERTQVAEMQTATSKAKANSVGRGATSDELEESCDPLEFLTKGYETLTEALGEIWDGIGQFATDLGIAVDTALGGVVDTANEVLSKAKQYATDLANAILEIISFKEQHNTAWNGIYHYSNEGVCSWYDFAKAIFEIKGINCKLNPIETKDYPTPAKRPHFSLLNKQKIKSEFGIEIPYWRDSLTTCLDKL
jgi:hypothetical protein